MDQSPAGNSTWLYRLMGVNKIRDDFGTIKLKDAKQHHQAAKNSSKMSSSTKHPTRLYIPLTVKQILEELEKKE